MSPCAALLLFLAIGLADPSSLNYDPDLDVVSTTALTTSEITTITTEAPTTVAPTTKAPTTAAPTTKAPTTAAPTTKAPTTAAPTTKAPTTAAPTTKAPTPAAPTTTAPTTAAPTTNATTTEAPTTTATSPNTTSTTNTTSAAPPTTTPTPTLPSPTAHLYQVQKDNVSCLLVKFGLRFGYQGVKYEEMNFEFTNETTNVSGNCGEDSSELLIQSDTLSLKLTFLNDTKKFSLHALNATGKTSSGVEFTETNNNLTLWQASLGNSYMCNKKQNYTITKQLTIFTFELQVQPFAVNKASFSTAQECSLDDTSILIPIVVGAALAGLILIVVIAYVIGRRKTYVGYQTL